MWSLPDGIELVFLPPYSPELQPAEQLWALVDEPIANRVFADLDALEAVLVAALSHLEADRERLKAHTHFHWWPPEPPRESSSDYPDSVSRSFSGSSSPHSSHSTRPQSRSELDNLFTDSVHAKDAKWGLIEEHSRFVFFEGDTVKENMKVASCKRQEIAVYVFRYRGTNRSVITSIWNASSTARPARKPDGAADTPPGAVELVSEVRV